MSHENRDGYQIVSLRDDNGQRRSSIMVHDIVASVFIRLLEQGEHTHHVDKNRKNNNPSNLKIISASDHARQHILENWANGTMSNVGEKFRNVGISKPAKQVAQLSLDGRLVKVWPSTRECGRNGFHQGHVAECCRGEYKKHKGFKWMWLSDYEAQKDKETSHLEQLVSS